MSKAWQNKNEFGVIQKPLSHKLMFVNTYHSQLSQIFEGNALEWSTINSYTWVGSRLARLS